MKSDENQLPEDNKKLQKMVSDLQSQVKKLTEQNQHLLEQFRLAQQQRFGKSTEGNLAQGDLFNEAEEETDKEEVEPETEEVTYTRKKPVRKPLPENLPRTRVVHDIAEEDKSCDCCGEQMHQMGEECSEQLKFVPAKVEVIVNVRPKYSCRNCEKTGIKVEIKIAPMPPSPIPKSISTPSLLAQIIANKFQYGLPLYRQESVFKNHGIELSRKTMSQWSMKCSTLLEPLYDLMHEIMLKQSAINADETTLNVLESDKSKCYMWVYCTGTDSPDPRGSPIPNIVLYDFNEGRGGQCAVDFLNGYNKYLQVDGYVGYESTEATLVGCWAHGRRGFTDVVKIQPKGTKGKANWAVNHIGKLYGIERRLKGCTPEEKYRVRQKESKPLIDEFKSWLDESVLQVPKSLALGKAIRYCLNQWDKLIRFLDDGHLDIDNNRGERAIKPFVIGRKNWMFNNTCTGARSSAILYSIVETAKANSLVPCDYIEYCLEELCKKPDNLDYLLPWNVQLGKQSKQQATAVALA